MSSVSPGNHDALPLSVQRRVHEVCKRFEDALRAGEQARIEDYLALAPEPERSALLYELLGVEREYRHRAGERPTQEDYRLRFPEDGATISAVFKEPQSESQGAVTTQERIAAVCLRFESAWQAEPPPRLEDFLATAPGPERVSLFCKLLGIELASRSSKGDTLDPGQYLQRFPEHSELILDVFNEGIPTMPRSCLGRYRLTEELGSGGFGVVYKGYDEQLGREVAIKMPPADRVASAENANAFRAEARLLASLDHPGIVPIYDVGQTKDGRFYLVSKFVPGNDLKARLRESRPSHRETAELIAQVAEALHYAHQHGLVHRDIKPANILLDAAGRPVVADFGLALRQEDFGTGPGFAGTPAYMSPEQARGEGHRVDARTDIYSLGVVFYELLTGERPFRDDDRSNLLEQIKTQEPRPPRQLDDRIPKELDRICLKTLSKRVRDRYSTAIDLAEDLRHWLAAEPERAAVNVQVMLPPTVAPVPAPLPEDKTRRFSVDTKQPRLSETVTPDSDKRPTRVVPKGLRSFDAEDADFFLELLPGPRNRDGLPESIRFWKTHIESTDPDRTFSVGLLYGPSGCGKSSLVKAGLLPRLADHVVTVYVEATGKETESRLLKSLRKQFASIAENAGLVETLASLRRKPLSSRQQVPEAGTKLLIVIDQFEQWLHARREEPTTELTEALRQCDGQRVQCLILVRDDFGMAVTRFMHELEIPILEGQNFATVDLFDPRHARKVLAKFGRAFGSLPDNPAETSPEQERFLDEAVAGLGRDGKVISVRLALFAEMVKAKPWTRATLKQVGGPEGLGVSFLEDTFGGRSANPEHHAHQKAVRAVLQALLPEHGTDLKGHMRSREELLQISGYLRRPEEFEALMRILDTELRLVTPTDPEGHQPEIDTPAVAAVAGRYYQLTHDYLVPALRQWLTRKQRETWQGRAELRLAERTALWSARPETRQLPSWWEWWNIELFTRKAEWTGPQRKMMRSASRRHALRTLAAAMVLLGLGLLGIIVQWNQDSKHADSLVAKLLVADVIQVPKIIAEIEPYRHSADPRLKGILADPLRSPKEQLHARLALLPSDRGHTEALVQPLAAILLDNSRSESEREVVASMLANYAADQAELLADLVVKAEPRQAGMLLVSLRAHPDRAIPVFKRQLDAKPGPEKSEAERSDFVKAQANAAVALLQLGQDESIWARFRHQPEESPELRTYLIHRLGSLGTDFRAVVRQIKAAETDESAKRALILSLGTFAEESLAAHERRQVVDLFLQIYRGDADPGVHAAVDWLLRQWKYERQLRLIDQELDSKQVRRDRRWYVNAHGQTMAIIASEPVTFSMGSPEDEAGRNRDTETLHQVHIPRSFAIAAKEVTVRDFKRFAEANPHLAKSFPVLDRNEDVPVMAVNWFQAAQYCRWLSEQEGIAEDQMCYPSLHDIQAHLNGLKLLKLPPNYLSRTGYRLPTEAEWEYACRAGARTTWSFGASDEMLGNYAWYSANSKNHAWPVGRLKPNDFGLFDMYGNALEWTHSWALPYGSPTQLFSDVEEDHILRHAPQLFGLFNSWPLGPVSSLPSLALEPDDGFVWSISRVERGGPFALPPPYLRSAARMSTPPRHQEPYVGFRVARTLR